jgi:lysozyme
MEMNEAGIALLKEFEGCRLEAYQDQVGVWTIGYGDTGDWVVEGTSITQERAEELLQERLAKEFEPGVDHALTETPKANEFSAMVCLAYNIGCGAFRHSSVLRNFNAGDKEAAADSFLKWDTAGGKVNAGLLRRRKAERALFLS